MSDRYDELIAFIKSHGLHCSSCNPCDCGNDCQGSLTPLNGDASFRKYYRLKQSEASFNALCAKNGVKGAIKQYLNNVIVVDAPPETQKNREFVAINALLKDAGVLVPTILAADVKNGFMILEDLGDTAFLEASYLEGQLFRFYYRAAVEVAKINVMPFNQREYELLQLAYQEAKRKGQGAEHVIPQYNFTHADYAILNTLPLFDKDFINMELDICREWLFDKALNLNLNAQEQAVIDKAFAFITESLTAQRQVAMHRDYHSRNIMITPPGCENGLHVQMAVIDFQDMVKGPIGYDAASFLYDCYRRIEPDTRERMVRFLHEVFTVSGLLDINTVTQEDLLKQIKLCAIQRHTKVIGLFNRLHLRDGKKSYLKDLPLVMEYLLENTKDFPELTDYAKFLEEKIAPRIKELANS